MSLRRVLQQAKHCVTEAEAIIEWDEDESFQEAIADLSQAQELIRIALTMLREGSAEETRLRVREELLAQSKKS